jgi:teichuronic acid biosynthesis glycosyltransferase TuaC
VKVLVVAEYYPRSGDPVRGVWTHRQAIAARDAGADVRVLVLHRPVPPLRAVREGDLHAALEPLRQRSHADLDGLQIDYLHYLSPPRPWSYGSWGAWAAPLLAAKLRTLRRSFPFDLVHAHYAVPAGDAIRRAMPRAPLVISVHGHDVYGALARHQNVRSALTHARLVLANSAGTARRSRDQGARSTRVVHLGADLPAAIRTPPATPTIATVGNLIARKRHDDVIRAMAVLRHRYSALRYIVVGDGPERERLSALARSLGVEGVIEFRGALPHQQAVTVAQSATLFVLPSIDEAFGVAYVEAMAAGVPAIGCRGEDGPEEIAAAGAGGIALVPPGDPTGLAAQIDAILSDPSALATLGTGARLTVEREFTWRKCGLDTLDAYEQSLARR